MTIKKRLTGLAVVAVLAAGLASLAAAPANAQSVAPSTAATVTVETEGVGVSAPPSNCYDAFCAWEHSNFKGRATHAVRWGLTDVPYPFEPWQNDSISSMHNNTQHVWCAFEHSWYQGARIEIWPYQSLSSLGWMNDRVSSFRQGSCW